jgi:tripartite-type tricarboxylate transporter receptor subunit TctC
MAGFARPFAAEAEQREDNVMGGFLGQSISRRAALAAGAAASWSGARPALAQSRFPNRPVSIVVPIPAGGGTDFAARLIAPSMSTLLGQPVVVENRPGGNDVVGLMHVARSQPDGHTLLMGYCGTMAGRAAIGGTGSVSTTDDFVPIGQVSDTPQLFVVHPSLPVNNLQELVAHMKANQATMQYSSAGVGSGTHLPCALFNFALGVNITMVPYRGEGPALQDVIADRIDYMCTTIQSGAVQAKQGTVKGIAVMAPKRAAIIPDLATTGEQGLQGVEATVWNGFFFPKGTPKPIVDKLHGAIETVINKPDIRQKMEALGLEILPPEQRTPGHLARFLPQDIERWGKVIKAAGISVD